SSAFDHPPCGPDPRPRRGSRPGAGNPCRIAERGRALRRTVPHPGRWPAARQRAGRGGGAGMTGSVRKKQGVKRERPGKGLPPRKVLEQGLSAYFGRPLRIAGLKRRPLATSSHAIERLRVKLASGERLRVIFKRLSPGEELYGNEREVLIYRRLLD